jgi:hypothetical protein
LKKRPISPPPRSHLCSTALTMPCSSLCSHLLLRQAVRAAGCAPPRTRIDTAPLRRPSPKLVPFSLFPHGRPIITGHPWSTSVPTGTSLSFAVTPQSSTAPPTAPKTAGQPPSMACPFCQGSPLWIALVSFFQSHFHPKLIPRTPEPLKPPTPTPSPSTINGIDRALLPSAVGQGSPAF